MITVKLLRPWRRRVPGARMELFDGVANVLIRRGVAEAVKDNPATEVAAVRPPENAARRRGQPRTVGR